MAAAAKKQAAGILRMECPLDLGPVKIEDPTKGDTFYLTKHALGKWLLGQQDTAIATGKWFDLLGSFGLAIKSPRQDHYSIVLSLGEEKVETLFGKSGYAASYRKINVMLPNRVWITAWANDRLQSAKFFMSNRRVRSLGDNSRLFMWNYGNVDGNGVCWGTTSTEHLRPNDPILVERAFFGSKLNEHLYRSATPIDVWAADHPDRPLPLGIGNGSTLGEVLNEHFDDNDEGGEGADHLDDNDHLDDEDDDDN